MSAVDATMEARNPGPQGGETPPLPADAAALETPFGRALAKLMRAHDQFGVWDKYGDAQVLDGFILTKEKRKQLPVDGVPSPETRWRMEVYYAAICMAIEGRTGTQVAPVMQLHKEGFGRVVLVAGRLVAVSRTIRDAHRFGFPSLAGLAEAGEALVAEGVDMVTRYPELAATG